MDRIEKLVVVPESTDAAQLVIALTEDGKAWMLNTLDHSQWLPITEGSKEKDAEQ